MGDFSAPNLGRHDVGVSPLTDRRSKVPAHGRGTPGRAGPPSGCSRGRVGDSQPDRSPSPPRARLPRRAARLHRILIASWPRRPPRSLQTPRLFAPGHRGTGAGVRGRRGLPLVPASLPPAPAARPPRAQEFQAQRTERFHHHLYDPGGGRSQAPTGARAPGLCSLGPLSLPGLESDPRGLGIPRAPEVGPRAFAASSACLRSSERRGSQVRSWAAGRSFGRPPRKHGETQLETQPEGTERTNTPCPSGPNPLSLLSFAITSRTLVVRKLGACSTVCSRGN